MMPWQWHHREDQKWKRREFCQPERTFVNGELRENPTDVSFLARLFPDFANCRHKPPKRKKSHRVRQRDQEVWSQPSVTTSDNFSVSGMNNQWECLQNSLYRSKESHGNKCWFCNFSTLAFPLISKSGFQTVVLELAFCKSPIILSGLLWFLQKFGKLQG